MRSGKWHIGIVHLDSKDTPFAMGRFIERFIKDHGSYVILDLKFENGKEDRIVIDGPLAHHAFRMAWRIRGKVECLR
jgi:hypothetical protein